jgi:uncharacterized protein
MLQKKSNNSKNYRIFPLFAISQIMLGMTIVLLFMQLFFKQGLAASFDCSQATKKIEKLICDNYLLSRLDEQMAALYYELREKAPDKELLKQDQIEWSKQRNRCKDFTCIRVSYDERITLLRNLLETANTINQTPLRDNQTPFRDNQAPQTDSGSVKPKIPKGQEKTPGGVIN